MIIGLGNVPLTDSHCVLVQVHNAFWKTCIRFLLKFGNFQILGGYYGIHNVY